MDRAAIEASTRARFEAWNSHDAGAVAACFAEDCVMTDQSGQQLHGRAAVREWAGMWLGAFGDLHFDVRAIHVDGTATVTEWVGTGTHDGDLMGIPASGRRTTTVGATCSTLSDDGLVVEERGYFDALGIMQAIGAVPDAAAARA